MFWHFSSSSRVISKTVLLLILILGCRRFGCKLLIIVLLSLVHYHLISVPKLYLRFNCKHHKLIRVFVFFFSSPQNWSVVVLLMLLFLYWDSLIEWIITHLVLQIQFLQILIQSLFFRYRPRTWYFFYSRQYFQITRR